MTTIALRTLLALSTVLYIVSLKLEQCPPGYRCHKRAVNRFVRSFVPQTQEEMDVEICEAGTYSPGGADECTPCEKGTYAAQAGAPACYNCPKGHMCPHTNVVPEQCPLGTYNDLTRQTCCRACQAGKFALLKGMFQCDNCPSGHMCRAGKKLACEHEVATTMPTSIVNLPPQCSSYTIINDTTRLATASNGFAACDQSLFSSNISMVRFHGVGGTRIVTTAPKINQCGTHAPGWYNGSMPATGVTVNGTVCYFWESNKCNWSNTISVTNCSSFYVYGLTRPPHCSLRYCTH